MKRDWIAPLCGALFVALAIVGIGFSGDGQDPTTQSIEEVTAYYQENDGQNVLGAFLLGASCIPLLFFASWLRQMLRRAEAEDSILPTAAFAGLVILVAGISTSASIQLALADYADDIDPGALEAINAISYGFFLPFAVGMWTFLVSTGIVILKTGVMPKWLGGVAVLLGIIAFTPAGFIGFIGGLAFILGIALIGATRGRRAPRPQA